MHFLGQVGRGEVYNNPLFGRGLLNGQMRISQRSIQALGQLFVILEEVQKTWARNLHLADARVGRQGCNQFFCKVTGLHAGRFCQHHGDIARKVAVTFVLGIFDLDGRRQTIWQDAFGSKALQGVLNKLSNSVFHDRLAFGSRLGA